MALIGWWTLDGNTEDYTVNQNHGTPNNVSWVNGKIGQAGSFNGVNSTGINIPLINLTGPFSYSLWVKPTNIDDTRMFLGGDISTNSTIKYGFLSGNLFVRVVSTSQQISIPDLSNKWSHIIIIRNSDDKVDLYIDGMHHQRLFSDLAQSGVTTINIIGGVGDSTGQRFLGEINDVRIYDHALSQKEINDLAKAKILHYTFNKDEDVVYDSSGYKRNGNKIGLTYSNNSKLGTGTYFSPNSTSGIVSKTFTTPSHITQSFWVYPTQPLSAGTGTYQNFLNETNDSLNFFYYKDVNYLYWKLIWSDNSSAYRVQLSGNSIIPNQWNHIVGTFDGTTNNLYLNGVLVDSETSPFTEIKQYNTEIHVFKENTSFTGGFENGYIDDVQIYATALSSSDVLDLYQTRIKIDNQGNLYANEIVEDYEVAPGLTLRELFEDNNRFLNFDFSNALPNPLPGTIINDGYATKTYITDNNHSNITPSTTIETGKKYFLAFKYRPKDEFFSYLGLFLYNSNPARSQQLGTYNASTFQIGKFREFSFYITANDVYDKIYFKNYATGINVGNGVDFDDIFFIPTTDIFGAGNEPSQAQLGVWYRDYITSRPKSSGIMKTREFSEIDNPDEPMKIFKDKIQIQGSIKEV